jgi:hypothetical protein
MGLKISLLVRHLFDGIGYKNLFLILFIFVFAFLLIISKTSLLYKTNDGLFPYEYQGFFLLFVLISIHFLTVFLDFFIPYFQNYKNGNLHRSVASFLYFLLASMLFIPLPSNIPNPFGILFLIFFSILFCISLIDFIKHSKTEIGNVIIYHGPIMILFLFSTLIIGTLTSLSHVGGLLIPVFFTIFSFYVTYFVLTNWYIIRYSPDFRIGAQIILFFAYMLLIYNEALILKTYNIMETYFLEKTKSNDNSISNLNNYKVSFYREVMKEEGGKIEGVKESFIHLTAFLFILHFLINYNIYGNPIDELIHKFPFFAKENETLSFCIIFVLWITSIFCYFTELYKTLSLDVSFLIGLFFSSIIGIMLFMGLANFQLENYHYVICAIISGILSILLCMIIGRISFGISFLIAIFTSFLGMMLMSILNVIKNIIKGMMTSSNYISEWKSAFYFFVLLGFFVSFVSGFNNILVFLGILFYGFLIFIFLQFLSSLGMISRVNNLFTSLLNWVGITSSVNTGKISFTQLIHPVYFKYIYFFSTFIVASLTLKNLYSINEIYLFVKKRDSLENSYALVMKGEDENALGNQPKYAPVPSPAIDLGYMRQFRNIIPTQNKTPILTH